MGWNIIIVVSLIIMNFVLITQQVHLEPANDQVFLQISISFLKNSNHIN